MTALFISLGIGSVLVRFVDNHIGPQYFAFYNKNYKFIENIQKLKNESKNYPLAILGSYMVHGVKGMNLQQFSGLQYLLPYSNLPKYVYKDELRSVGCYENKYQKMDLSSHYLWKNFSSEIKFCLKTNHMKNGK